MPTQNMLAQVNENYGSPDILQLQRVTKPTPTDNELLVRVHATTVNRTDCANLTANPAIMRLSLGMLRPRKKIGGTEFAGEVVAVGGRVKDFKVGDRVFGFDDGIAGAHAEYLCISDDKGIAVMPQNISYGEMAGCIEGAHYGYNFINKVNLKKGDKVLVNGASGAIGSATVQLLRYFGAEVTAVCNTKSIALIRSLGARKTIDYCVEDFTLDDEKYNYVFDSVGKSSFGKCAPMLLPGGVYISSELGSWSQNIFFSLISYLLGSMPFHDRKMVKFPYPPDIKRTVLLVKKLIETGQYKPVIDRVYPLKDLPDAYRYVLTGQKTGSVVINIS